MNRDIESFPLYVSVKKNLVWTMFAQMLLTFKDFRDCFQTATVEMQQE